MSLRKRSMCQCHRRWKGVYFEGVMGKYIVARGRWKGVYFEDVMGK